MEASTPSSSLISLLLVTLFAEMSAAHPLPRSRQASSIHLNGAFVSLSLSDFQDRMGLTTMAWPQTREPDDRPRSINYLPDGAGARPAAVCQRALEDIGMAGIARNFVFFSPLGRGP
jgi:hypothetical protein